MKHLIVFAHIIIGFTVFSQKSSIKIEVSETEPLVGQNITISITTSLDGKVEFQLPKNFQKGYAQMEGMSQEYNNGVSKTIYYKTQNGFFTEKGNYIIGPAIIRSKNKVFKSNKVKIAVKKSQKAVPKSKRFNQNLKTIKTIYGETNISKNRIYEGEAVHLNAKVYSQYSYSKYGYTPFNVLGKHDNYELKSKGPLALVEESVGGELYYTIELDGRVIFPIKSGKYIVEPFEMAIIESSIYRLNSDQKTFTVLKLPSKNRPSSFLGLVGDFDFDVKLSSSEAEINEVITLQISIDGRGNFQHAVSPTLILPEEVELYADPVEIKNYKLSKSGFEGQLTYTYPLKVVKKMRVRIPEIELSYFDAENKKYVTYNSGSFEINKKLDSTEFAIVGDKLIDNQLNDKGKLKTTENVVRTNKKHSDNQRSRKRSIIFISLSAIALCLVALLWMFFKRKENRQERSVSHVPSSKEIAFLLNEIDELPDSVAPSLVLMKMEECLSKACSFIIGADRMDLSRNELFVLLVDKLNKDELIRLKRIFTQIDTVRYSKDSSSFTENDIKSDLKSMVNEILTNKLKA